MIRKHVVSNALELLRNRGPTAAARHLVHWCSEEFHERRFGISTRQPTPLSEFGYDDDRYVDYEAPAFRTLFRAFRHLDVRPGESVFLDYGCGRGRALAVAATFPFRKVVGVELVPQLLESARDNLRSAAPKLRCREAEFIRSNAVDHVPGADVDHIYMFNPFRGSVLREVVDNIDASWAAAPRPLTIVYLNPDQFEDHARDLDWLEPVRRFWSYPDTTAVIYRSRPRA